MSWSFDPFLNLADLTLVPTVPKSITAENESAGPKPRQDSRRAAGEARNSGL